jgi:hypothetical protein
MKPGTHLPARAQRLLTRLALALVALATVLVVSGCGDDQEEVESILTSAFEQPIESADVTIDTELQLEGNEQFGEPIRAQVSGPYVSGEEGALPSFDFDVSFASGGTGIQIPTFGLISTGDNVFVEAQGEAYEVGEEEVGEAVADQPETEEQGLAAFGIDPRGWIVDGEVEGDEEVAGVETTHVTGTIDVAKMLTDLNQVAEESSAPDVAGQTTLTPEQISQAEEVLGEPRFDLFVGKDDDKIRRLTASVDFTVPEEVGAQAGGLTGGSANFSLEFANVGGDQQIAAPENPRPITDLFEQIGGLFGGGLLPGAPDSGSGEQGGTPPLPGLDPGAAPDSGATAPEVPGGASPDAQQFQEYSECLQQADPDNPEDLAKCNELLGG